MYACVYACMCICMYVCLFLYLNVRMFVCVYVYMYDHGMYVYMYGMCVYTYVFLFRNCAFDRGNLDFVIVTLPISSGIIMHIVYMNIYIYIFM